MSHFIIWRNYGSDSSNAEAGSWNELNKFIDQYHLDLQRAALQVNGGSWTTLYLLTVADILYMEVSWLSCIDTTH